ncbi:MAG: hypothetical protein AAF441_14520, partial [Pseudomonadota bacterium]
LDLARQILLGIATALDTARRHKVEVGIVKPTDILLDDYEQPHLSPRVRLTYLDSTKLRSAIRNKSIKFEELVYSAPELLDSANPSLQPREKTDQYSLGVLAYHLLTGNYPETLKVEGNQTADSKRDFVCELLAANSRDVFLNVETSIHERRPEVPARLNDAFMRMMSRDPERRYSTLRDALKAMCVAERATLIEVRDSYDRCMKACERHAFFEAFYKRFIEQDGVSKHFGDIDDKEDGWTKQYDMLERAIEASFDFARDAFVSDAFKDMFSAEETREPNALTQYARKHAERGISLKHYEGFTEALVQTVCGPKGFDPESRDPTRAKEIGRVWRDFMGPVITYFNNAKPS